MRETFEKIRNKFRWNNIKYRFHKACQFPRISIISCLILFTILGIFFIGRLFIYGKLTLQEFIYDFILIITAMTVVYYVIETHKLRKEAAKQNRMAIYPLLMVYLKNITEVNGAIQRLALMVKNIGKGIAFEPKVDQQYLEESEKYKQWYEYKIEEPLILPNEEYEFTTIFITSQKKQKENAPFVSIGDTLESLSSHKCFIKDKNFPLRIRYKDIEKSCHFSEVIVKPRERITTLLDFK